MSSTALSSSTNLKKRRNSSKLSPFLPLSPSSSSYPSNLTSPSDSDSESEESFLLRELALRARRASARNSSIALVQAESGGETIGPDGEKGYWKFVSTDGEKGVGEGFDVSALFEIEGGGDRGKLMGLFVCVLVVWGWIVGVVVGTLCTFDCVYDIEYSD